MELFIQSLYATYLLLIVFVPAILGYYFWKTWVKYVRLKFHLKQEYILLEFKLPKEITKSPVAMEVFMNSLSQTSGEATWFDRYWGGGMRAWFSLELVSIEGQVKFFIWTRNTMKKTIENHLYSQYPNVEIAEVDDYTEGVEFDPEERNLWGCYFVKVKDSFFPIKTYVDYGLDRDPKEEFKIDPLTPVLEYLGSIGPGEQIWIQILIRAHKAELPKPGTWFGKVDWKHFAKEEIKKMMKRDKGAGETSDKLTKGERSVIEAIEDNISKVAFDTGIRALYIADKEHYNKSNQAGIPGSMRQYGSTNLNAFRPDKTTSFDFPWQDFMDYRLNNKKRQLINLYKKRGFFRPLYSKTHFILSAEELATIYHFPGQVSRTPTVSRINSKKADAPSNLPV